MPPLSISAGAAPWREHRSAVGPAGRPPKRSACLPARAFAARTSTGKADVELQQRAAKRPPLDMFERNAVSVVAAVLAVAWFAVALALARLVFGRLHEVDRARAGVVALAMPGPVLRMAGWHVQVGRLYDHRLRLAHDD